MSEGGGGVWLLAIKKQYKANTKREFEGGMMRKEEGCHSWQYKSHEAWVGSQD